MKQDDEETLREQVRQLHSYFMQRDLPHKKTRAEEIDELLAAARAGKLTARATLWLLGFIAAAGAAYASTIDGVREWLRGTR